MSVVAQGNAKRECRQCGAGLVSWNCATCGASAIELVASAYIAELATAWRPSADLKATVAPVLSVAA